MQLPFILALLVPTAVLATTASRCMPSTFSGDVMYNSDKNDLGKITMDYANGKLVIERFGGSIYHQKNGSKVNLISSKGCYPMDANKHKYFQKCLPTTATKIPNPITLQNAETYSFRGNDNTIMKMTISRLCPSYCTLYWAEIVDFGKTVNMTITKFKTAIDTNKFNVNGKCTTT